jgi:hypothetical protein
LAEWKLDRGIVERRGYLTEIGVDDMPIGRKDIVGSSVNGKATGSGGPAQSWNADFNANSLAAGIACDIPRPVVSRVGRKWD